MGFPVLVIVTSDNFLLKGTFSIPLFDRTAVRRLLRVDGLQDFCIFATGVQIN